LDYAEKAESKSKCIGFLC